MLLSHAINVFLCFCDCLAASIARNSVRCLSGPGTHPDPSVAWVWHGPKPLKGFNMPSRGEGYGINFPLLYEECHNTLEFALPTPIPNHTFKEIPLVNICTDHTNLTAHMNFNMEMRAKIYSTIENGGSDDEIADQLKICGFDYDAEEVEFFKENCELLAQDFIEEREALEELIANADH